MVTSYEHLGDPAIEAPLTARQHGRQREAVALADHVTKLFVDNPPPPLSADARETLRRLLTATASRTDLMRWRLRLYCAHVVERTSDASHMTVHAAFTHSACETCGLSPATIVAARPVGLLER